MAIRRDFGDVMGPILSTSEEDWMRNMGIAWTVPKPPAPASSTWLFAIVATIGIFALAGRHK